MCALAFAMVILVSCLGPVTVSGACINTTYTEKFSYGTQCCLAGTIRRLAPTSGDFTLEAEWDFFSGLTNAASTSEPPRSTSFNKLGNMLLNANAVVWNAPNPGVTLGNLDATGSVEPLISEKTMGEAGIFANGNKDFTVELWLKPSTEAQDAPILSIHDPATFSPGITLDGTALLELRQTSGSQLQLRMPGTGANYDFAPLPPDWRTPKTYHVVIEVSSTTARKYSTMPTEGWMNVVNATPDYPNFHLCQYGAFGFRCAVGTKMEVIMYIHPIDRDKCAPYDFYKSQLAPSDAQVTTTPFIRATVGIPSSTAITTPEFDLTITNAHNNSKLVIGHIQGSGTPPHWKGQVYMAAVYKGVSNRYPGYPVATFLSNYDQGIIGYALDSASLWPGINLWTPRSLDFKYNFAAGLPTSTPYVVKVTVTAREDDKDAGNFTLTASRITSSNTERLNIKIVTKPPVGQLYCTTDGLGSSNYNQVTTDGLVITVAAAACSNSGSIRSCTAYCQYQSPLNANGNVANFTYQAISVADDATSSVEMATIDVTPVNDKPLAPQNSGPTTVRAREVLSMTFIQTDCCNEGNSMSLVVKCLPTKGKLFASLAHAIANTPAITLDQVLTIDDPALFYKPDSPTGAGGTATVDTDKICLASKDNGTPAETGPQANFTLTITNPLTIDPVTASVTEDTPYNISFVVDNKDTLAASVHILTLPTKGTFKTRAGVPYTNSADITVADEITFYPNPQATGSETLTIAYKRDSDGFSSVSKTLTINIAAVNDPPNITAPTNVITGTTTNFNAGSFVTVPFEFNDVAGEAESYTVTVSLTAGAGAFSLAPSVTGVTSLTNPANGMTFAAATQVITKNALGNIRFAPTSIGSMIVQVAVSDNGDHTTTASATVNITCPMGYTKVGDASTCTACSSGKFKAADGFEACTSCSEGAYQNQTGKSQCESCDAGTFSNTTSLATCYPCPLGTFTSGSNKTSCTTCPAGETTAAAGSAACVCTAGKTRSGGNCVDCSSTSIKTAVGDQACTACTANVQQANGDFSACICVAGYYWAGSQCEKCTVDTYKSVAGDGACTACNSNKSTGSTTGASTAAQCECKPGLQPDGAGGCIYCPPNTYKTVAQDIACTLCPVGTNTSAGTVGATTSALCITPSSGGGSGSDVIPGVPMNAWQVGLTGGFIGLMIGAAGVYFTKHMVNKRRGSLRMAEESQPEEQLQDWMTRDVDEELAAGLTPGLATSASQVELDDVSKTTPY